MKIVHFLSGMDRGGAQRMVATLTREQTQAAQVSVWLKCRKERTFLLDPKIKVRELSREGCVPLIRTVLRLRRMLKYHSPDVLVAHTNRNTVPAIIAGRIAGVPTIAMEHSVYDALRSRIWRMLRTITYPLATAVVVLSSDQRRRYPASRVFVIANPVDLSAERTNPASDRDKTILRVIFAGRLEPVKGADRLIEVCRRLSIPFHLDVVGSGSEEQRVRKLVVTYGLETAVTFHGWQSDLGPFFKKADVIAVTSRMEGFGLAVVEAMSHGCIPVVYAVEGGLKDILEDGINGYLVGDGNPDAFADRLTEIWKRTVHADEMRTRARSSSRRFSSTAVAAQWFEVLRTATGGEG